MRGLGSPPQVVTRLLDKQQQVLTRLLEKPPPFWPRFTGTLRSVALTARVGRVLGITFTVCFVTGLLSHYQYHPWTWLPEPAAPVWGYRLTQGLHVATGIATIPLLLVKLWSVYPRLFEWPPARSLVHALERASIAVLVSSALVELFTGFFNSLDWYPWPWTFVPVHRFLAYVAFGSLAVHIAVKLPVIQRGLATPLREAPPESSEPEIPGTPAAPEHRGGISRRGVLVATGAGIGVVVVTNVGQTITPLEPIGLLAIRQGPKGPQDLPVNRTADEAAVKHLALDPGWKLDVFGPNSYTLRLDDLARMSEHEADFPISCVEGWSRGAHWRGLSLVDLVRRAGGDSGSRVRVTSLEPKGSYNYSYVDGPQLSRALLATHLNGERLDLNHGYPLRLIAPDRAGVLNTKWLSTVEILS